MKEKLLKKFKEFVKELRVYETALSLMSWDFETHMPKKAAPKRAEVIGALSGFLHEKIVSDESKKLMEELTDEEFLKELNYEEKRMIELAKKLFDRMIKVPEKLIVEFDMERAKAQAAWEEAKKKSDFNIFKPHLKKVLSLSKEIVLCYKPEDKSIYDTMIDEFEPNMSSERIKEIIKDLKEFLIPFIDKVVASQKKNVDITGNYDIRKQEELAKYVLKAMGYDFEAGNISVSAHPFTISIGPKDTRVTVNYNEKNFIPAMYSAIHEGGHALYGQGIPEEYYYTPLFDGASYGIHESQSRFWENIIGRSRSFLKFVYPKLVELFPDVRRFTEEDVYRAVNKVEKSLIRVEADEVTYNLHIMLRFDLEIAMIEEGMDIDSLPEEWNKKMKEYLDLIPPNDAQGVLQDVHWSHGSFGYFPSYMLGNLYAAQIYYSMKKDIPNFENLVEKGDFKPILNWLREKVHKYGKLYDPEDLIEKVTGEKLNPKYFEMYLKEKYEGMI